MWALAVVLAVALPRAAIYDPGCPPGERGDGFCTPAETFERHLGGLYETERLDDAALAARLSRTDFDLLVVPTGPHFPAAATNALVRFLRDGGNLFTCGGYAFDAVPYLNTRDARVIRDCLRIEPTQIGAFDPSHVLEHVASVGSDPSVRGILPDVSFASDCRGYSAVGVLSDSGHGFGPNRRAWQPILACRDARGDLRGYAGAFVRNVSGVYAGSSWAVFGVKDRDLFASGSPAAALIRPVAENLAARLTFGLTTTDYASYRHGETAMFSTTVVNSSARARTGSVDVAVRREDGSPFGALSIPFALAPGAATNLVAAWRIPDAAPDYLTFAADLHEGGRVLARETGAIVVWDEKVLAGGPTVRRDGLRLAIDGKCAFFFGAQDFWGQIDSETARSPQLFREDFRRMRANGLRFVRLFLGMQDERRRRFSDAVVQLAQKEGLVLYHTPNLAATSDGAELAREREIAAEIGRRYRGAPGLMLDLCNEPQFDEGVSRDAMERMFAWAEACRQAAKRERPDLLVSIGWMQRWGDGGKMFDPPFVSRNLDFTDQHYYSHLWRFAPEFKECDLRALGKPVIVGECGGKEHPTFYDHDPWGMGESPESFVRRFEYLILHTFGLGGAAISCWHWRDPMEGIFPCGLVRSDGVAREALDVFASYARTLGDFELADNPPDTVVVLKEAPRMKPGRMDYIWRTRKVDAALRWWGANWSKISERDVGRLTSGVRLTLDPDDLPTDEPGLRRAVGEKLRGARAFFTRRPEDDAGLCAFRVPGKDRHAWVFWNDGDRAVRTVRDGVRLEVRARHGALLVVGASGGLLRLEGAALLGDPQASGKKEILGTGPAKCHTVYTFRGSVPGRSPAVPSKSGA